MKNLVQSSNIQALTKSSSYKVTKKTDQNGFLRRNADGRQLAGQGGRQRASVGGLRVVDGEASQLLSPGVFSHGAVDVLADVLLLGLFGGFGLDVTGDVFPVAVAVSSGEVEKKLFDKAFTLISPKYQIE